MSLYHETAAILKAANEEGRGLKSRVFNSRDLTVPSAQVYALAVEACKWSSILKEVIEQAELLQSERKVSAPSLRRGVFLPDTNPQLSPVLALLLVHDLLISRSGIALPQTHGLRVSIEKHKTRLASELTRVRVRRRAPSLEALRKIVEAENTAKDKHPRWVRINSLKTSLDEQLETTFQDCNRVRSVSSLLEVQETENAIYIDADIPNLIAFPPGTDLTKTKQYKSGGFILQDKASCFPAYLLDPGPFDGDIIDACAAPGNKTTHLASILSSRGAGDQKIHAFEKDGRRAQMLERMVEVAGSTVLTLIHGGQDFLRVNPDLPAFSRVGALLLDPSCSGSGMVQRYDMPELFLPQLPSTKKVRSETGDSKILKRKREGESGTKRPSAVLVDDDGEETRIDSAKELQARLAALATFQLSLLTHAFSFPAATKVTYSTCSIHQEENEEVVVKALQSEIARQRGWRVLDRQRQVRGIREWPIRGILEATQGNQEVADACIRTYKDDGRGTMGFFVAGFIRDVVPDDAGDVGPYLRDDDGVIIRDVAGLPTLKDGRKVTFEAERPTSQLSRVDRSTNASTAADADGPYLRDNTGRIVRDAMGMPTLKARAGAVGFNQLIDNLRQNEPRHNPYKSLPDGADGGDVGDEEVMRASDVDEWHGFND
jgi:25S rRNA (cytosine2278-C5)-methyltransferase